VLLATLASGSVACLDALGLSAKAKADAGSSSDAMDARPDVTSPTKDATGAAGWGGINIMPGTTDGGDAIGGAAGTSVASGSAGNGSDAGAGHGGTGGGGGLAGTGGAAGTVGGAGRGGTLGNAGTGGAPVCVDGRQQCIPGDLVSVRSCSGGQWVAETCPNFTVCTKDACTALCDGMLAASTVPAVCVFPYNEGGVTDVFLYTNSTSKLTVTGTSPDVTTFIGSTSGASVISSPSGTTWPFYWRLSYPTDSALVGFGLKKFTAPIHAAGLFYKVKRANTLPSAITNELVSAGDSADFFAAGTLTAPSTWRVDNFSIDATSTPSFDYDGAQNILGLAVTGDGFGNTPDQLDVNWLLLKVTQ
jgi:hypothetical protein